MAQGGALYRRAAFPTRPATGCGAVTAAVEEACAKLRAAFPDAANPEFGFLARAAGAAPGILRTFPIPLLEHRDATGFTRRAGDRRVIVG
ncbi:SelB C-terminal domain-containing protein [uncultured Methylobacterium sp.]|uniref:SelB domain-containing protein n=1 Tax=uncultured Methylobacterium sp. TaxID=157278 RepID=UPI0035CA5927